MISDKNAPYTELRKEKMKKKHLWDDETNDKRKTTRIFEYRVHLCNIFKA